MTDEVRLIDAEKLKRKLIEGDGHDDDRFTEGYNFAINEVREYIDNMPTIEAEPVTWYTAEENQPDSVGEDVLIVDRDGKYHVAYYCSKGNWIDTNTGNPLGVAKWRYLDGDIDG